MFVLCATTQTFFVLLIHYYNSRCKCSNSAQMIMSSPVKERAVIDIRATVESHSEVADDLLAIHGLSGADAVAPLHGICKATVAKVAKKGCFPLFCIGDVQAEIKYVEAHATKFMCACIWQGSSTQLYDRTHGQHVALKNREEWCIINETLFHSTSYWSIHRKCAQMPPSSGNMEGCTSWVTTRNGLNRVWLGAWPPR